MYPEHEEANKLTVVYSSSIIMASSVTRTRHLFEWYLHVPYIF